MKYFDLGAPVVLILDQVHSDRFKMYTSDVPYENCINLLL